MVQEKDTTTKETSVEIIKYIADTTKTVIQEIRDSNVYKKPFEFTIKADTSIMFEIFITGTKTCGDVRELTMWKNYPAVKAEARKDRLNNWWVQFSSFSGGYGADNQHSLECMDNGELKQMIEKAIHSGITDFTEQNTL